MRRAGNNTPRRSFLDSCAGRGRWKARLGRQANPYPGRRSRNKPSTTDRTWKWSNWPRPVFLKSAIHAKYHRNCSRINTCLSLAARRLRLRRVGAGTSCHQSPPPSRSGGCSARGGRWCRRTPGSARIRLMRFDPSKASLNKRPVPTPPAETIESGDLRLMVAPAAARRSRAARNSTQSASLNAAELWPCDRRTPFCRSAYLLASSRVRKNRRTRLPSMIPQSTSKRTPLSFGKWC